LKTAEKGACQAVAPRPVRFHPGATAPVAHREAGVDAIVDVFDAFEAVARRALGGFDKVGGLSSQLESLAMMETGMSIRAH
jgi:hypothetical protein